jgi:2-dehydro-3-deoxyphosphooctonate aldolase (KDO 8-P synthase)
MLDKTMTSFHHVTISAPSGDVTFGNDLPFSLFAGPCAMESRDHALFMAEEIKKITDKLGISFVYKTSFDKANRTSMSSERGVGLQEALPVFQAVKDALGVPVLTDIHLPDQCAVVGEVVDVLQIPAFMCRQTDLLIAAAKTGRVVKIKKGQFLSPSDMKNVAQKVLDAGNPNVLLTERGASFGYNTLVSDFRGLPTMARDTGLPIIFDATHSVQQPGGQGATSGGQHEMVPTLSRAAIAVGVAGIFAETHQDPMSAPSDGPNMIPLEYLETYLSELQDIDRIAKGRKNLHFFSE